MNFEIVETIPHDKNSYTQGYFFKDNFLYESTGLYGRSSLRKINPTNGEVLKKVDIEKTYFAEGIEHYNNKIYMLTWREQACKVFDLDSFQEINKFNYAGEGWGISLFENNFYVSNGSNTIQVIDPENFKLVDKFSVFNEKNQPLVRLNELQVVGDFLLANIWFTDEIVFINLKDKKFIKSINFLSLRNMLKNKKSEVMNGIAYDSVEKSFYITGKFWDLAFKIKIHE